MLATNDVEVIQQKQELDRNFRINCLLAFIVKKKEITDVNKYEQLEKLQDEFRSILNPSWFVSFGYINKINEI